MFEVVQEVVCLNKSVNNVCIKVVLEIEMWFLF